MTKEMRLLNCFWQKSLKLGNDCPGLKDLRWGREIPFKIHTVVTCPRLGNKGGGWLSGWIRGWVGGWVGRADGWKDERIGGWERKNGDSMERYPNEWVDWFLNERGKLMSANDCFQFSTVHSGKQKWLLVEERNYFNDVEIFTTDVSSGCDHPWNLSFIYPDCWGNQLD